MRESDFSKIVVYVTLFRQCRELNSIPSFISEQMSNLINNSHASNFQAYMNKNGFMALHHDIENVTKFMKKM